MPILGWWTKQFVILLKDGVEDVRIHVYVHGGLVVENVHIPLLLAHSRRGPGLTPC